MRVTTTMMIRNYQTNLSKTSENKMNLQNKVLTQRNFCSVKEDPSAAAKASNLTRQYLKNSDYMDMAKDLRSKIDSQEDSVYQVVKYAEELYAKLGKESLNGTNLSQRDTYANTVLSIRDSILQSLNAMYSNTYIMAGANGTEAPFAINADGKLTYREVPVDSKDPNDLAKLKEFNEETLYVDIGLGLEFQDALTAGTTYDEIISSTAFDVAFSGLKVVWNGEQGKDVSGLNGTADDYRQANTLGSGSANMANNLVDLCTQLARELSQPDGNFDYQACDAMVTQIKEYHIQADNALTGIGVKENFLEKTVDRLEANDLSLATQLERVVTPDMAAAITNYSYAQYAYNAALRIGVNLLSQSFLDFMR